MHTSTSNLYEVFIIYVAAFSINLGDKIYPLKRAQIAHLKANEAFTKVLSKYTDFIDIFLPKLAIKLFEHTEINNHTIEFVDDWQPLYGSIYSFRFMELGTLKIYIKKNLANNLIRLFKSFARISIFFDKKLNESLKLYVDYCNLNNLTIENLYPLFLIKKSLNQLNRAWRFT